MRGITAIVVVLGVMVALSDMATAQAPSSVTLTIDVTRQAYKARTPQPFPGVGLFELHRGGKRMENALCPDNSNDKGLVFCRIECREKDANPASIVVQPPSGQDLLAGWVVPVKPTVALKGCTLAPKRVAATYMDPRSTLDSYIRGAKLVALATTGIDVWQVNIAFEPRAVEQLHEWAKTPEGRARVLKMVEASAAASGSVEYTAERLTPEHAKELEALVAWQVGSKNALLKMKADQTLKPMKIPYLVKVTASQDEYVENLRQLEKTLEKHKLVTPETVKFEDDVKTLRSLKSIGADPGKYVGVIRGWQVESGL